MLDRGEQDDWFGSLEIMIECALAVCGFWMFTMWTQHRRSPLPQPGAA